VESLLGRDIDIDLGAAVGLAPVVNVGNTLGGLVGNLAGGTPAGSSPQDSDLTASLGATNVPVLDTLGATAAVTLDPVETLLGRDIDIDLGAAVDLAPVVNVGNTLGGLVGNLAGGTFGSSPQDTDLTASLGATNVPVLDTLGATAAVTLDPVESLLGRDIDIDLGAAVDLAPVVNVGSTLGGLVGNLVGGTSGSSPQDTDLTASLGATNVPVLDTLAAAAAVTLDPVESLLGRDIDIDLGLLANLDVLSSGGLSPSSAMITGPELVSPTIIAATGSAIDAPALAALAQPAANVIDLTSGLASSTLLSSQSAATGSTDILANVVSGAMQTMNAIDSYVSTTTGVLSSSLNSTLSTLNGGNFSILGLSAVAPSLTPPTTLATTDINSVLGGSSIATASLSLLPTAGSLSASTTSTASVSTVPTPTGTSSSLLAALTPQTSASSPASTTSTATVSTVPTVSTPTGTSSSLLAALTTQTFASSLPASTTSTATVSNVSIVPTPTGTSSALLAALTTKTVSSIGFHL
jgi:hypothetical protein